MISFAHFLIFNFLTKHIPSLVYVLDFLKYEYQKVTYEVIFNMAIKNSDQTAWLSFKSLTINLFNAVIFIR